MIKCPDCNNTEVQIGFPIWHKLDFKRVTFPVHCPVCLDDFDVSVKLDYDSPIMYTFDHFYSGE